MYRCTGCGSTETIEEIRKHQSTLSCCPGKRKMMQVIVDDPWLTGRSKRSILALAIQTITGSVCAPLSMLTNLKGSL